LSELGRKLTTYEAVREEITGTGFRHFRINIMVAIARDYEDSVRSAIDAKANVIISGGGLPLAAWDKERQDLRSFQYSSARASN
jgi:hypothetical protein